MEGDYAQKTGEIVLYNDEAGGTRLQVRMIDETVWLTQQQMTELFERDKSVISRHIRNVYEEGEVEEQATVANFATVRIEGGREVERRLDYYSLDVIISVGYRVKSQAGVRFRRWATTVLREYMLKGFAIDDARLKEPDNDYFDELLARVRDIRSSEKVMYQKVTDIFATSTDYTPKAAIAREFFGTVQNKLHWATHRHTAAEIIQARADARKRDMGLTNYPKPHLRKQDVRVAKNYLDPEELEILNLLVSQYFDFAETQAKRRRPMKMADWVERLDLIITLDGDEVLGHKGQVSMATAEAYAEGEYGEWKAGPGAGAGEAWEELAAEVKRLEN